MRNIITCLLFLVSQNATAQFTEMKHGYQVADVEDIEVGYNGNLIFATNTGILLYNNGTWKQFNTTNGLEDHHILSIEPYTGGFYFTSFNKLTGYCDYQRVYDTIFLTGATFSHFSAVHIYNNDTLLGTNNGIIYRWNSSGRNIISQGAVGWVHDINLLSGTVDFHVISTSDKIYLYQASSGAGFIVSNATTPMPSNNVLSNAIAGSISYDGTDKGLYIADFTNFPNMNTQVLTRSNSAIPSDTISSVAVSGNIVVVGTPKGIALRRNGNWHAITPANSNLPAFEVNELAINGSELWLSISELGKIYKADLGVLATSVEEYIIKDEVKIYPNPANDKLFVEKGNAEAVKLEIISPFGITILSKDLQQESHVNISMLPSGVYFIRMTSCGQPLITKTLTINH